MRAGLVIGIILFLSGCSQDGCRESIDPVAMSIPVEHLEVELFESKSARDVELFLDKHREFATLFLDADQYPEDSILAQRIFALISNPSIDTLYQEATDAFKDMDAIVAQIEVGLGRLKTYYPETQTPKIQTVVTGLYKDLFISNEDIMIGMDFFVGERATFKPVDIPNYILRRYNTEHLPSIIMKFVSSQYVRPAQSEDMLAEMIDFGKSLYLVSKILPCTPERILMGYTETEWDDAFKNDAVIWANFIQNELLFETNHSIKQKFLAERPNVYEIGDKCPGRIGVWLGWQIVKDYMDNSEVTVQALMLDTDYNKIFRQSGYKPG